MSCPPAVPSKQDKQIRIAVRLPEGLKEEFMQHCKDNAINSSELVRQLIQRWLREEKTTQAKKQGGR